LALYYTNKNEQAKAALEKAIELDPENKIAKQNLIKVEDELSKEKKSTKNETSNNPFGGLGGMGGMGGMGGGLGGMDMSKIGEMMQNPDFMNMAMNMMKQPGMQQMMKGMMQNMGGDMGGSLDTKVIEELENHEDHKNSEKLQGVVKDLKENGMSAVMNYLGDSEVQQWFMKVAKEKVGNGEENPFKQLFGGKKDE
jgi:hypothetical protein